MVPPEPGAAAFRTTRWSIVLAAGGSESSDARAALETLCRAYWYPLYAYVRRQGHGAEDAQDLTQAFFARMLEKRDVAGVDRRKGTFRSFLLASLKHFLSNARDGVRAKKRGGGAIFVPIDTDAAEARYGTQLAHAQSPDKIFERQWALALLDHVMARLRAELTAAGNARRFEALKPTLTGGRSVIPYAELGSQLGMTEGAVKVAVHRLRQRYRELLRAEISHTVSEPAEMEEELRHLAAVLAQ